jgi:hypothetical protein
VRENFVLQTWNPFEHKKFCVINKNGFQILSLTKSKFWTCCVLGTIKVTFSRRILILPKNVDALREEKKSELHFVKSLI